MRPFPAITRSWRPIWEPGMPDAPELLRVAGLNAWYGESHILHGMDFTVAEGEVVTLLGRNGAGKTTTLRAIMGIVAQRTGSIRYQRTPSWSGCRRTASRGSASAIARRSAGFSPASMSRKT